MWNKDQVLQHGFSNLQSTSNISPNNILNNKANILKERQISSVKKKSA